MLTEYVCEGSHSLGKKSVWTFPRFKSQGGVPNTPTGLGSGTLHHLNLELKKLHFASAVSDQLHIQNMRTRDSVSVYIH